VHINPRFVSFNEDFVCLLGCRIPSQNAIAVLQSIELLQNKLRRKFFLLWSPLNAGHVVFSRVASQLNPASFTCRNISDSNPARRILLPRLGIGKRYQLRISIGRVVDHCHYRHARCVELPVRDLAAIGAPAKSVSNVEFFFVHPVGRAVDDVRAVGFCDRHNGLSLDVFHIDVSVVDLRHRLSVR